MIKIKNPILAAMVKSLGVEVKAELIIDDSNGTSLTFPDISDVSEIAVGVAVSAPDGTYVIANDADVITIVVENGLIITMDVETPDLVEAAVDGEVVQVLEAIVAKNVKNEAEIVALKADLAALKATLKHDDGKASAAAAGKGKTNFKVI